MNLAIAAPTMRRLTFRAVLVWSALLPLAVANGLLREAVLIPALGAAPGLALSGILLAGLILVVAYLALPWLGTDRPAALAAIGAGWLALTLGFEFAFGLLRGQPLPEMLAAYTFAGGNLWPVVLLVTGLAPGLAAWLHHRRQGFRR